MIDDTARRLALAADRIDPEWAGIDLPLPELVRLTRQLRASRRCQLRPSLKVPTWGPNFEWDEDRGRTVPTSDEQYVVDSIVPMGDVLAFGGA